MFIVVFLVVFLVMIVFYYSRHQRPIENFSTEKFIYFKIDEGGYNNIRMNFEILTALAYLSKRTLVLPPATKWYLLGDDFIEPSDIYDINAWKSQINVITANESPFAFKNYDTFFKELLLQPNIAEPPWASGNGYFNMSELEKYKDNNIWYFYPIGHHRVMSSIECYFTTRKKELFKVVSNALVIKKEFYDLAIQELTKLGFVPGEYDAIHVRKWEGETPQYEMVTLSQIMKKIESLDSPILYLSKDVISNDDITLDHNKIIYPSKRPYEKLYKIAIVDMLMAAFAKRFIGSPYSTYSIGIMLLRGKLFRNKFSHKIDPTIEFITPFDHETCNPESWNFQIINEDRWEYYENYNSTDLIGF